MKRRVCRGLNYLTPITVDFRGNHQVGLSDLQATTLKSFNLNHQLNGIQMSEAGLERAIATELKKHDHQLFELC